MSVFKSEWFMWWESNVLDQPVFPILWVPHCILMSMALRTTLGANWQSFSRQHPLSCLILGLLYTFPGGLLATALMAQPVLSFTLNTPFVLAMLASWYLVFFSPQDLFYRVVVQCRLGLPLSTCQDLLRLQLVVSGVQTVLDSHPGSFFYPVIFAICKSSGFMFLKYAEYILINGLDRAFVIPHHSTKTCIVASVLVTLEQLGYLSFGLRPLCACLALVSLSFRLLTAVSAWDPYAPVENVLCAVLFGRPMEANPGKKGTKGD